MWCRKYLVLLVTLIFTQMFTFCGSEEIPREVPVDHLEVYQGNSQFRDDLAAIVYLPDQACTGVLISRQHVLSAAHCFAPFGHWYLMPSSEWKNKRVQDIYGHTYTIEDVRIPDNIKMVNTIFTQGFDLAIVKLKEEVNIPSMTIPQNTKEIEKSLVEQKSRLDFEQSTLFIAGYGLWSKVGDNMGQLRYAKVPFRGFWGIKSEEVHTGTQKNHACQGDSGGPVFMEVGHKISLIGIHSRKATYDSLSCADSDGTYHTFLMHPEIKNWIQTTLVKIGGDASIAFPGHDSQPEPSDDEDDFIKFTDETIYYTHSFLREFHILKTVQNFTLTIDIDQDVDLILSTSTSSFKLKIKKGTSKFTEQDFPDLIGAAAGAWSLKITRSWTNRDPIELRKFVFKYR